MTITGIYNTYHINKGLSEHMIRVSAVAKQICDHTTTSVDIENIVAACLVHDMGNLIKAVDMEKNPALYEPEGIAYWQRKQQELIEARGESVDQATKEVVVEIGVTAETMLFLEAIGNDPTESVCATGSLGEKIANYSDMRVGMHGIISLSDRIGDIRIRYANRGQEAIDRREAWLLEIEKDIFSSSNITAADITDESTKDIQKALWDWEIKTTN